MLGRHVYRVSPTEGGTWTVRKDGGTGPLGRKNSQDAALAYACELAQKDEPARVVVESGDGKLLEERKFGLDPGQSVGPA